MSDKLLKRFQSQLSAVAGRLDKFAEDFAKDPAYTLAWSNDTFKAAAKMQLLRELVNALENGNATLDNIRATLMDRVLNKSKYPPQSTSPTSNLIEQYQLAACAEILSDLQYIED